MNFDFLFLFQGHGYSLVEAKKKDPSESLSPEEKYFWLLVNEKTKELNHLTFVDMDEEEGVEFREFEEGQLTFDHNIGELIIDNETAIAMDRIHPDELSDEVLAIVTRFMTSD